MIQRFVVSLISVGLMVAGAGVVSGQNYPIKPIRVITSGLGGGTDSVARLIAQGISGPLGQQLVVENRSGVTQGETVARAAPDGYTLLVTSSSFWTQPLLQSTPYDPVRDFAPVTLVVRAPMVLVVHPSLPVKSVKELVALAQAKPGMLNYSVGTIGTTGHLAMELFKSMAGINMTRIPYKSGGMEMADLLSGEVQLTFVNAATVVPHVKSGRLRAVAIATMEPSALFPGLPTVDGSGLPGYESSTMQSMFAPAKTPQPIIERLNREVVQFLKTAESKERFLATGQEAVGSSPEQLAAQMKSEIARLSKVIKDTGMRLD